MWEKIYEDTRLRTKYLNFAFRVLTRRNDLNCSIIERLNLFLPNPSQTRRAYNENVVDRLLRYAVTKYEIHELELSSFTEGYDYYELSKDIIRYIHSLTSLSLSGFKLDQQFIANLAVYCPFLKSLTLKECSFPDRIIRISGFHKLVNLAVILTSITTSKRDVKVEIIEAFSLVKFWYVGNISRRVYSLQVNVVSDSACLLLKHMDLSRACFDQNSLSRIFSNLPNLQHLNLSCYFLSTQLLHIRSPNLEYLDFRLENSLERLHIDAPNVTEFVYSFHCLDFDAMPVIFSSDTSAFNPEKVSIKLCYSTKKIEDWLLDVQFNKFVRQLDEISRHLTAHISIRLGDTLPCLRGFHTSIYDFKRLVLFHDDFIQKSWPPKPARSRLLFADLIDTALCLFPNLQTCIIVQRNVISESLELKLEFKYKEFEVDGCWEERVQEVNIKNIRGSKIYISRLGALFEEALKAKKMFNVNILLN